MPIADNILALGPVHYWKCATTAGQLSIPDEMGSFPLTSAINDGGGAPGPETGTTAQRLYSDQIWTSPAFNQGGWINQTWVMLFTFPANGSPPTPTDVGGFGDPSNRAAHGFRLQQSSTANAQGTFRIQGSTTLLAATAVAYPQSGWHLLAVTLQASPAQTWIAFDGVTSTALAQMVGAAPVTTDRFWLQSASPIIVAHIAVFNTVLNTTQLTSVAGQIPVWPLGSSTNMPAGGGGTGGGLTTDQAAQLDDIQTKVSDIPGITAAVNFISDTVNHIKGMTDDTNTRVQQLQVDVGNIINSLFPQMANVLNDIGAQVAQVLDGITTTITNAAGAVTTTIGQLLEQHSADVLGLDNLTSGPTCSDVDLNLSNSFTWGISVHITTRPDKYWPMTPDNDWSKGDLAVVLVKRAEFEIARYPVHGTWETIYPLPEALPMGVAGVAVPTLPQNYHIIVHWAQGVCGEVLRWYIP